MTRAINHSLESFCTDAIINSALSEKIFSFKFDQFLCSERLLNQSTYFLQKENEIVIERALSFFFPKSFFALDEVERI